MEAYCALLSVHRVIENPFIDRIAFESFGVKGDAEATFQSFASTVRDHQIAKNLPLINSIAQVIMVRFEVCISFHNFF